jgi:hypothetical protein
MTENTKNNYIEIGLGADIMAEIDTRRLKRSLYTRLQNCEKRLYVGPSGTEQLVYHWTDFHEM